MVDILRLGSTYTLGLGLICISFCNQRRWQRIISDVDRVRCYGIIVDFYKELRKGPDATGYVYRLWVKYKTETGKEIIALSQNPIHSPKEYFVGESVEVAYLLCNPKSFYICDDQNRQTLNRFIFICGLLLCVMGTAFVLLPNLFLE